jgi:hypothetical protein
LQHFFNAIHPNVASCGSAEKNTFAMLRSLVFALKVIGGSDLDITLEEMQVGKSWGCVAKPPGEET